MHLQSSNLAKLLLAAWISCAGTLWADDVQPPRLSLVEGAVSFWRPGAPDWVEARINTPLAVGDALYAGPYARLELQLGSGGFVRAGDEAQLTLVNQTADYLQLSVPSGRVVLDIAELPAGYVVEVDTPQAVFTIDRPGYYRADVGEQTRFAVHEQGVATLTLPDGGSMALRSGDEVRMTRDMQPQIGAAPAPDAWDDWNYDRSEEHADSRSQRYLPAGIAGAAELDRYGEWRVVQEYGPLWMPHQIPVGWVPYSSGYWIWDPYYQWTWVDDAPWGWAPFHYGRWVNVGGHWMWAPGTGRQPVYAPALVGFLGSGSAPHLGWVALSWGEPVFPWWGHQGFIGQPWWGGWGGPRIGHHKHVKQSAFNPRNIHYANAHRHNAVVVTAREQFGRSRVDQTGIAANRWGSGSAARNLQPLAGRLPIKPAPERLVGDAPTAVRPPDQLLVQPVLARRPAKELKLPWNVRSPAIAQQRLLPEAFNAERRATGNAGARSTLPPAEQTRQLRSLPKAAPALAIPNRSAVIPSERRLSQPPSENPVSTVIPGQAERPGVPSARGQVQRDNRAKPRTLVPPIGSNPVLENARSVTTRQPVRPQPQSDPEQRAQEQRERSPQAEPVPRPAEQARELLSGAPPGRPWGMNPAVREFPQGINPPLRGNSPTRTPPPQAQGRSDDAPQGFGKPQQR